MTRAVIDKRSEKVILLSNTRWGGHHARWTRIDHAQTMATRAAAKGILQAKDLAELRTQQHWLTKRHQRAQACARKEHQRQRQLKLKLKAKRKQPAMAKCSSPPAQKSVDTCAFAPAARESIAKDLGETREVHGLTSEEGKTLNGLVVAILSHDLETGRVVVQWTSASDFHPGACRCARALVRAGARVMARLLNGC